MKGSFRLGSIAGIDIRINYTWIFIFVLISWSLAQGFFPQSYPDWSTTTYWVTAVIAAILLFVSVLAHEFSHSITARSRGMSVNSITLFIFGGVSNLEDEPEAPRVEFIMAMAGPLISLGLAGAFWGFLQLVGNQQSPLAAILFYLAAVNGLLGVFNLLPGFPLDGGRVLRSFLWRRYGDIVKATNIAGTVGRFIGWGIVGFGVFQLLTGNFVGGLWLAFIGWFLASMADASRREMIMRQHLRGVKVRQVMDENVEAINPDTSVQKLVEDIIQRRQRRAAPVAEDGQVQGIVTVRDLKGVSQDKWRETPVGDIMTRQPLYSVGPDDELNSAIKLITSHDINQLLVMDKERLVGLLNRADVLAHLQVKQELGLKSLNDMGWKS